MLSISFTKAKIIMANGTTESSSFTIARQKLFLACRSWGIRQRVSISSREHSIPASLQREELTYNEDSSPSYRHVEI